GSGVCVARVVDALAARLCCVRRRLCFVEDGQVVACGVAHLVKRPDTSLGATLRFDPGVVSVTVLEDLPRSGPRFEPGCAPRYVGNDLRKALALGAIFGSVRAVCARDRHEALAIDAV